jgi:hypothetical protein
VARWWSFWRTCTISRGAAISTRFVAEGKFGNSVAGSKGDPRIVGDTIDFAVQGTGNGKSGRGDKGLSTTGDNPLGRNDRDVTESIHREFAEFLKEGK